jgi:hypothetical protein
VVAVGVVVLVGLLAVLDGDGDGTAARPAATTTSSSSTTTTRRAVVTTAPTTSTTTLPSMLLGQLSGVRLLVHVDRGAIIVDLDTGAITLPEVSLVDAVAARSGGVVIGGPGGGPSASYLAAPYDGTPVPIAPLPVGQIVPSAHDDRVWLVSASGPPFRVVEVSVTSEVTTPEFPLPGDGYVAGAVDDGLVVAAHGSIFVVRGADDITPLGAGEVLDASGRTIAAIACDDAAQCSLTMIDARTGRRRPTDVGAAFGQATFSPDGSLLAFLAGSGRAPPELVVVDVATGSARDLDVAVNEFDGLPPAFSFDGRWLFNANGSRVEAVNLEDGTVTDIPLDEPVEVHQVVVLP